MLFGLGTRLKRIRTQREVTLTELAAVTGIPESTRSRVDCEQRESSLERPRRRDGRIVVPLAAPPRAVSVPCGFNPAADRPVEIVSILWRDGERVHVRPSPRPQTAQR